MATNATAGSAVSPVTLAFALDSFWMVFGSVLIFFMQIGFTMLEVGSVNIKNTRNILTKNVVNITVSLVAWWVAGYGLAHGRDQGGVIGGSRFFAQCNEYHGHTEGTAASAPDEMENNAAFYLFQWGFAATSATIVSGAVAERITVEAFALFSAAQVGFIYPVIVHSVWSSNGWASLRSTGFGVIDFAGSGVVHMTGGLAALIGAAILGPRKGRFDEEGHVMPMSKQSTTLQTLGTLMLWVGWIAFNSCSTLSLSAPGAALIAGRAATNTLLAGAAGGLGTLLTLRARGLGTDIGHIHNGILSGCVSVTASCATLPSWAAVVISMIAGPLYLGASSLVLSCRIDDVLDASAVHLFCGIWGVLCSGIFPSPRSVRFVHLVDSCGILHLGDDECDGGRQFGYQVGYVFAVISWVGICSSVLFFGIKRLGFLRESVETEEVGIDIARHNGEAYQIQPIMAFPPSASWPATCPTPETETADAAAEAVG